MPSDLGVQDISKLIVSMTIHRALVASVSQHPLQYKEGSLSVVSLPTQSTTYQISSSWF